MTPSNLRYREPISTYAVFDHKLNEFYSIRFLTPTDAETALAIPEFDTHLEIVKVGNIRYRELQAIANGKEKNSQVR